MKGLKHSLISQNYLALINQTWVCPKGWGPEIQYFFETLRRTLKNRWTFFTIPNLISPNLISSNLIFVKPLYPHMIQTFISRYNAIMVCMVHHFANQYKRMRKGQRQSDHEASLEYAIENAVAFAFSPAVFHPVKSTRRVLRFLQRDKKQSQS